MIAPRASVGFDRSGSSHREYPIVVAVGPGLYPFEHQNNRNSSLSLPRIKS